MNNILQEISGEIPRDPWELRPSVLPSSTGMSAESQGAEAWEGQENLGDEASPYTLPKRPLIRPVRRNPAGLAG